MIKIKNIDSTRIANCYVDMATTDDARGDAVDAIPNHAYVGTVNEYENPMDTYYFTANSSGSALARADWDGTASTYATMSVYEDGTYITEWSDDDAVDRRFKIKEGHQYTIMMMFSATSGCDMEYNFNIEI